MVVLSNVVDGCCFEVSGFPTKQPHRSAPHFEISREKQVSVREKLSGRHVTAMVAR